jgi:hypothetical protein
VNLVLSLWTKPCTDGKAHGYSTIKDMISSLILSVNVAKKHYPNIHFYTDKLGYEWIKPHLHLLPFTKIEICLDDVNWVEDVYWSLCKIYVYSLQKEPFIHIDNDVFLWEPIPEKYLEGDFVFQEVEGTIENYHFYKDGLILYQDAVPKEIVDRGGAFNCGVFGVLTQRAINLLPKYYDLGCQFVNTAREIGKEGHSMERQWLASVLIEQLAIYSLVNDTEDPYKWSVFLRYDENGKKEIEFNYTHMVAASKKQKPVEKKIEERIFLRNWDA